MEHHKISEYIDNLKFKKRVGGFDPEQVYEAIRELSSMYNELLSEAYAENERLKNELENDTFSVDLLNDFADREMSKEEQNLTESTASAPLEKQVKELRKLKRKDLLEILLDQSRKNEDQRLLLTVQKEKILVLEQKLNERRIDIAQSGTLAEASLKLNGVFEAAQAAAQQYLDNLKTTDVRCAAMERATKERCEAMKDAVSVECDALVENTKKKCELREKEAEERCMKLDKDAKEAVDKRWDELSSKLEAFYNAHAGLKELLSSSGELLR